jgi:hypothetical protein
LLICNCEQPAASAPHIAPARAVISGNTIEGIVGAEIEGQNITISISGQAIKLAIGNGADLSSWITNLPAGLGAKATGLFPSGGGTIIMAVEGTPLEITIPEGYLTEYKALPAVENPETRFYIINPDATVKDVTINWTEGGSPVNKDVEITLVTDTFSSVIAAETQVDWIQNLPAGLGQKIKDTVNPGGRTATITVLGTPEEPSAGIPMEIEIPAGVLTKGHALAVMRNPYALFQIIDSSVRNAALSDVFINGAKIFNP